MKRWSCVALVAVGCWVGCGEGGSLPEGNPQSPSMTNPDGSAALPGVPAEQPGQPKDTEKPLPYTSLWPLTQGSTWRYRITDPGKGTFEKKVEVLGPQTVPQTSTTATAVLSTQPNKEEISWQLELQGGMVVRLREEDRKAGAVAQSTTWKPATVKSLATEQSQGWKYTSDIRELTVFADSSTEDKDKTYIWSVTAVNETVTTPAGTFTNALRLERKRGDKDKPGDNRTYWLVPGIGKVKEDGERLEELVAYDVKKP